MEIIATSTFAPITTERLLLRLVELSDAEDLFAFRSLPEVTKYQAWKPKDLTEVKNRIRTDWQVQPNTANSWLRIVILLKESKQIIGDCGIHFLVKEVEQVEVGYTLDPAFQGKGYATEAVKGILHYVFNTLNKHRVIACLDPENIPSASLLERIGFRKEAHFIRSYNIGDRWVDTLVYAMLLEEWEKLTKNKEQKD